MDLGPDDVVRFTPAELESFGDPAVPDNELSEAVRDLWDKIEKLTMFLLGGPPS
jgi:hypothetical protein